jgi:hypothetical protein
VLSPSGVFRNFETGGHIDGHKNLTTIFGKLTSVDLFFFYRTTNVATFFFLLTFSSSQPRSVQRGGGGHPPFTCLLAHQKMFSSAKGGATAQCPPPYKYATAVTPSLRNKDAAQKKTSFSPRMWSCTASQRFDVDKNVV